MVPHPNDYCLNFSPPFQGVCKRAFEVDYLAPGAECLECKLH